MEHVELIGSPSGAMVASAIFGAMAVLIGIALALILGRLAAPPGEVTYWGTTSRPRRIIGGVVALAGLAVVWVWLWSGFYSATVAADTVELLYLVPLRTHTLPRRDIARVTWIPKPKGQRALQIVMSDGTTYTSVTTSMSAEAQQALQRAIKQQ